MEANQVEAKKDITRELSGMAYAASLIVDSIQKHIKENAIPLEHVTDEDFQAIQSNLLSIQLDVDNNFFD